MAEKMLVTQALDERDLLAKKISDKIVKLKYIDCKKRNEDRTMSERVSAEDFTKNAQSGYQQIMDLIDRREYGIELLQQIRKMQNCTLLMGNHEDMMVNALRHPENLHYKYI